MPKALQDCLKKEAKLHEKKRQQEEEIISAQKEPCRDQRADQQSDSAGMLSANAAAASASSPSPAAEPLHLPQTASTPRLGFPGRDVLTWTEWGGKHTGMSGEWSCLAYVCMLTSCLARCITTPEIMSVRYYAFAMWCVTFHF